MKKNKVLISILSILLFLITSCGDIRYTSTNYDVLRNNFMDLDTYGQWITVNPFGEVWKPNTGYDWRPYDDGQWQFTNRGWMWFSNEPYGWIVYHYGNWVFTDLNGWVWIPGYEWSPSRVNWITQDEYIGWAPLPPSNWNLPNVFDVNGERIWTVVQIKDFDNRGINRLRIPTNSLENKRDWKRDRGPDPENIRKVTGRNITPIDIRTDNVRSGKRDLTRVRIIDHNQPIPTTTIPPTDQNNFTPPPVGRTQPPEPTVPHTRTNTGDRNANNQNQKVEPPKTRIDLVEPKKPNDNPIEKQNPPVRIGDEKKEEKKPNINTQVIRNKDEVKNIPRVVESPKAKIDLTEQNRPNNNPDVKQNPIAPNDNEPAAKRIRELQTPDVSRNNIDKTKTPISDSLRKPIKIDDPKNQKNTVPKLSKNKDKKESQTEKKAPIDNAK
jgi:hypothetical protein